MYLFGAVFILIILCFVCIHHRHRKELMKKVCFMGPKEKREVLNELIAPFGYSYIASQDIISSRIDAWQREFGYHELFDKAASYANMIIDCLPVYFDYLGRTWLIEFWKGQYGINAGCEIGIYYAERILREKERTRALFHCVGNEDMLKLSFTLSQKGKILAKLCAKHWWLTAFCPGRFVNPADLTLNASVTLLSPQMAKAFANALPKAGYGVKDLCAFGNTVSFTFAPATLGCHSRCRL